MNLESLNNPYKTILMAQDKDQKTLNVPPLRFPGFTDEWKKCLVSDYGDIVTGTTPSTNQEENYSNGEYLWASPSDLGTEKYIYTTQTRLSKKGFDKTRPLPPKAILVTCIGSTIGKMGMAKNKMSTNQQINSIIVNGAYDADFVYYAIQSKFPRYISSIAVQAVPILSKSEFGKLYNVRTSVEEQMKIGEFLSKIDERIETQNKIIEDLKKLKSVIRKKLFANLKNLPTEYIEIGELLNYEQPSEYIVASDEYISDITKIPVLTANKGFILGYTEEQFGVYSKGDCIIFDDFTMDAKYVTFPFKVKSSAIKILTAKSNVNLRFMFEYLQSMDLKSEEHKRHYISEIATLVVAIPMIEIQNHIACIIGSIDRKLTIEQQIAKEYELEKLYFLSNIFI